MIFGWPLSGDSATLSGGAWETGLPLQNLQTPALGEEAHSVDAEVSSTVIRVDQGSAKEISIVSLQNHNMRSADKWRVRVGPNADGSGATFDSGTVDVWGAQWPIGLLPSGHPNATTRKYTDADIARTPRDAVMILPQVVQRHLLIELDVTANVDGYARAGRLSIGPRYQPTFNFSVGAEFGFSDNTIVGKAQSGARFYRSKRLGRSFSVAFVNIPDAEAYAVLRDLAETLGQEGQLYVVSDPTDVEMLQRRSFLANLRSLSAAQYAAAGVSSFPMVLDEVIP